jgi:hypothetical protein
VRSVSISPAAADWQRAVRRTALVLMALLPAACATPRPPGNPFVGAWSTGERQDVAFRNDTIVLSPPGEAPTPMSAAACDGQFRFGYGDWSRDILLTQVVRQPEISHELERELTRPDYRIASVACGDGGTIYVMLDDHTLLAIHRDQEVAGLERLTRP